MFFQNCLERVAKYSLKIPSRLTLIVCAWGAGFQSKPVTHREMDYTMDPDKVYPNLMKNQVKRRKDFANFQDNIVIRE